MSIVEPNVLELLDHAVTHWLLKLQSVVVSSLLVLSL